MTPNTGPKQSPSPVAVEPGSAPQNPVAAPFVGKSVTVQAEGREVVVRQVSEGRLVTHKKKEVRTGQRFEVSLEGKVLGFVERRMLTRERRGEGMRYVYARWESPGWVHLGTGWSSRGFECPSKIEGVRTLVREELRQLRG